MTTVVRNFLGVKLIMGANISVLGAINNKTTVFLSKMKTTCGDTMWKSLNWVVPVSSSEKNWRLQTRRFDQYALIVLRTIRAWSEHTDQNVEL